MIDNFQRNINYLRISVTDRCNLRCQYCMAENGLEKKSHQDILSLEDISYFAKEALKAGITKIRITGGEPLVRKGILTLIEELGIQPLLKDFAMTTNGILLSAYAKNLKELGLHRLNISLDTLNPDKFKKITRGGSLNQVLIGLETARKYGFPIKINTVLMGGINDDEIAEIANLAHIGLVDQVRFIELMPIGETADWSSGFFLSNEAVKKQLNLKLVKNQDENSPSILYEMDQGGLVGLINPISHQFCSYCNRIRLTADGKLKLCLLHDEEIDIKKYILNQKESLDDILKHAIQTKPQKHLLEDREKSTTTRNMVRIGG